MEFILTERFCQDLLEEYIGNQRKIGGRSENPDIFQFGYNDSTIPAYTMFHILQVTYMVGMIGSVAWKI